MAHPEDILGWIVYPMALTFADGAKWSPNERGECMRIYWRDKNHQNMRILPPGGDALGNACRPLRIARIPKCAPCGNFRYGSVTLLTV